MTVHSGKFARINGIDTVRKWSIAETEKQPKGNASNTLNGHLRRQGVRSWTGSYEAYGAVPVVMPGDTLTFHGYGAPANDVSGNGLLYEGDAVVSGVSIKWNWQGGDILSHSVRFEGHLELDKVSGADPGDSVAPNAPTVAGTKLQYSMYDLGVYAELPNLTAMELSITCNVDEYVNSSTYISSVLWTGRKAGPIDWTMNISQQDDERLTGIFDIGQYVNLRAFVDLTTYWELTYGIIRDFSGITADRETGATLARTINVDMNAYYGSTAGHVKRPNSTQYWP